MKTKRADTEVVGPLRIERAVMDKIRKYCEAEERTIQQQIRKILRDWADVNGIAKK